MSLRNFKELIISSEYEYHNDDIRELLFGDNGACAHISVIANHNFEDFIYQMENNLTDKYDLNSNFVLGLMYKNNYDGAIHNRALSVFMRYIAVKYGFNVPQDLKSDVYTIMIHLMEKIPTGNPPCYENVCAWLHRFGYYFDTECSYARQLGLVLQKLYDK